MARCSWGAERNPLFCQGVDDRRVIWVIGPAIILGAKPETVPTVGVIAAVRAIELVKGLPFCGVFPLGILKKDIGRGRRIQTGEGNDPGPYINGHNCL